MKEEKELMDKQQDPHQQHPSSNREQEGAQPAGAGEEVDPAAFFSTNNPFQRLNNGGVAAVVQPVREEEKNKEDEAPSAGS